MLIPEIAFMKYRNMERLIFLVVIYLLLIPVFPFLFSVAAWATELGGESFRAEDFTAIRTFLLVIHKTPVSVFKSLFCGILLHCVAWCCTMLHK